MTRQGKDFTDKKSQGIGTDLNTGKLDFTCSSFQRTILEKATNMNEAIEIVKNCDIHKFPNLSFHYLVGDANGKFAIIEWAGQTNETDKDGSQRTLNIVYPNPGEDFQVVSNYVAQSGYYPNGIPYGYDRYQNVYNKLAQTNGLINDLNTAMDILSGVSRKTHSGEFANEGDECTLWSVVYDLTNKKMVIVDNEKFQIYYDKV